MSDALYEKEIVVVSFYQHIGNSGFYISLIKKVELYEYSGEYETTVTHYLETSTSTHGHTQTNRIPLFSGCESIFSSIATYFKHWKVPVKSPEEYVLSYKYPEICFGDIEIEKGIKVKPSGFDQEAYNTRERIADKKRGKIKGLTIKKIKENQLST
jgi:hypothetical protein